MPVYNTADYLYHCVKSIISQSFTCWECILIDDGSNDGSGEICDQFVALDSRISVIHQKNKGVSLARNEGILHAKGKYLTFIDSDDWIDNDYLKTLFDASRTTTEAQLIVAGLIQERPNNIQIHYSCPSSQIKIAPNNISEFNELIRHYLLFGPCTKLYLTSICLTNNILFDKQFDYGEDLIFNLDYLKHTCDIIVVDSTLYHYRISNINSLSNKVRENQFDIDYNQWKKLKTFYQERNLLRFSSSKDLLYRRLWGILYAGVLEQMTSSKHLRHVLNTEEINIIKKHSNLMPCSKWIKICILYRAWYVFWLYHKLTPSNSKS